MKFSQNARFFGKDRRGGFTLVELIVVLIILAILAAFLIPSLMGYIDKARQKQIIMQTRQAVMAAQTLFDEAYASDLSMSKQRTDVLNVKIGGSTIEVQIYELAELDKEKGIIEDVATDNQGKILKLTWTVYGDSDITCQYNAKESEPYKIISPTLDESGS